MIINANIYWGYYFGVYLDWMKIEIHPNYLILKYIDFLQMDFLVHLHEKMHYHGTPNLGKEFFFLQIQVWFFSYTVKGILNLQYLSNDFFFFRHH